MTEVWQYSIPITIAATGLFHLFISQKFEDDAPLNLSLTGFGFILMAISVWYVNLISIDPTTPNTSLTWAASLITMVSIIWTFLYAIFRYLQNKTEEATSSGEAWRR